MKPFFVYMLRCSDGSFYVGHTDDLDKRVSEHQTGLIGGYTSEHLPVKLVHSEAYSSRDEAFSRERQLKGWSRAKKRALIQGDLVTLKELARRPSTRPLRGLAQDERQPDLSL